MMTLQKSSLDDLYNKQKKKEKKKKTASIDLTRFSTAKFSARKPLCPGHAWSSSLPARVSSPPQPVSRFQHGHSQGPTGLLAPSYGACDKQVVEHHINIS